MAQRADKPDVSTAPKSFHLGPAIHAYLTAHLPAADSVERSLVAETAALGGAAIMQIAPEQAALLRVLARVTGARRAVEVGTFTGYSALSIARGMTADGKLLCCDVNEEWTAIARRHWQLAGLGDRIDLALAPAVDTLASLPEDPVLDLSFLDADKGGYIDYYEALVPRTRPGGLIVVDNVLWFGRVADPTDDGDDTVALRAFNDHVLGDDRVDHTMVPVADGLSLFVKR